MDSIPSHKPRFKQAAIFQRLRRQLLRNTLAGRFQVSFLRLLLIGLFSLVIWAGVFAASREGFRFIRPSDLALGGPIVGAIFDLMFLSLGILLIFSSGIILYSSLFSSSESTFLLGTPARADQIFAYKFQGALAFSSWAFVLLGSPVLIAYGLDSMAPWYYYPMVVIFFFGFVLLPGAVGGLFCLLITNYFPRKPKQILAVAVLLVVAGIGFWGYRIIRSQLYEPLTAEFGQRLLNQLALTRGPLAPNHWMSRGLQAVARSDLKSSLYSLALVWSNGLFLYLINAWAASHLYRRGFNRVLTGSMLRRRYGGHWLDRGLSGLVSFLDRQTRLLIIKDFRTFRRDPAQWAQVLIFLGLTSLYFVNVRRFYQEDIGRYYKNAVSLVNLAATSLLLCAYTGRFIFPMLSLEGRKFWILGLLPLPRERLLAGKFAFSATWALLVAEFLVILSDVMLGMPPLVVSLHIVTVAVVAFGLSGLSVGLGAWMPNFQESDPSKIAVGFGGTLNLVVSLFFLIVVIALMAGPLHLGAVHGEDVDLGRVSAFWLWSGMVAGLAVGMIAVVVPIRIGARTLRRMEF